MDGLGQRMNSEMATKDLNKVLISEARHCTVTPPPHPFVPQRLNHPRTIIFSKFQCHSFPPRTPPP